jgi:murein DD-endopeptidase MepM/ murein hydrolase activator NlpD
MTLSSISRSRSRITFFLLLFSLLVIPLHAASNHEKYPRIPRLASDDPVFSQYSDDVLAARMALAAGATGSNLPLGLYSYLVQKGDTILDIAAMCSIPYDSIVTLNRIASIQEPIEGRILLLPTVPGLYLPEKANSTFENLLISSFNPDNPAIFDFTVHEQPPGSKTVSVRVVHCIPDTLLEGTVRTWFLTPTLSSPLPGSVETSPFGMRKNPVSGHFIFHEGVDLAAPRGTPVLACSDGTVEETGSDPIYGNYIILRHAGKRESLYGHLQSIKIELHQKVKSGTILGTVGSTGQSTGPHLHFEIRENGVAKNPAGFIKGI